MMQFEMYLMFTERTVLSHGFAHQLHGSVSALGMQPAFASQVSQ